MKQTQVLRHTRGKAEFKKYKEKEEICPWCKTQQLMKMLQTPSSVSEIIKSE